MELPRHTANVVISGSYSEPCPKQLAGVHTHVLDGTPEDTDVFHVLTRKPSVPEMVITKQFVFQVDPDGSVKYVGKPEDVLKKK